MVKDQHPQGAKEAAENVLPAWLDAFKVLLDLDPQQDVSGEYWDGLEIRIQIFKVRKRRAVFFFPRSPRRFSDFLGLVRTDARHDTYVFSTHTRPAFTCLCCRFSASPPRALSNIRAVLSRR
jgi:hypothetical protein